MIPLLHCPDSNFAARLLRERPDRNQALDRGKSPPLKYELRYARLLATNGIVREANMTGSILEQGMAGDNALPAERSARQEGMERQSGRSPGKAGGAH